MAIVKISALPSATGGNAADVAPIVQSGATKKVALSELFSGSSGGQINFPATQNASAGANCLDDYEEGTYTVAWTSSGTQPAKGNGSFNGVYTKIGQKVLVSITITMGSTTTFGTGNYTFSLPFTSTGTHAFIGSIFIVDSGTGFYIAVSRITGSTATISGFTSAGAQIGATTPHTWAVNDELNITCEYIVA